MVKSNAFTVFAIASAGALSVIAAPIYLEKRVLNSVEGAAAAARSRQAQARKAGEEHTVGMHQLSDPNHPYHQAGADAKVTTSHHLSPGKEPGTEHITVKYTHPGQPGAEVGNDLHLDKHGKSLIGDEKSAPHKPGTEPPNNSKESSKNNSPKTSPPHSPPHARELVEEVMEELIARGWLFDDLD